MERILRNIANWSLEIFMFHCSNHTLAHRSTATSPPIVTRFAQHPPQRSVGRSAVLSATASAFRLFSRQTRSPARSVRSRVGGFVGAASLAGCLLSANGASAQTASDATVQASPAEWSAALLLSQCKDTSDPTAQAQCVGSIRGIVHGYQYGVLLTANENHIDTGQMESISICLNGVPVKTLIAEFVADASQASSDDLAKTPAETVVLGVIHHHHRCE